MKKGWIILVSVIVALLVLWFVAKVSGAFVNFQTPSHSMEPAIKAGATFFITNLKKPKRNNIIIYYKAASKKDYMPEGLFVSRIIAFENETLELRNGLAYVNGRLVDDSTNLVMMYRCPAGDFRKVLELLNRDESPDALNNFIAENDSTNIIIQLSYADYQKAKKITNLSRYTSERYPNEIVFHPDSVEGWTAINYGPYKIPKGNCFVLGDNRYESADSRYRGPVLVKDIKGVVLWK